MRFFINANMHKVETRILLKPAPYFPEHSEIGVLLDYEREVGTIEMYYYSLEELYLMDFFTTETYRMNSYRFENKCMWG